MQHNKQRTNSFSVTNSEAKNKVPLVHFLVQSEAIDRIKEAIKKDVDISVLNKNSQSPLHIAARKGNLEIVKILLNAYIWNLNDQDYLGESPIFKATRGGHLRIIRYLRNCGAELNVNLNGKTILQVALQKNKLEIVEYLIRENLTALKDYPIILRSDYKENLKSLVKNNELTEIQSKHLLRISLEDKHFDVANILLDSDVECNFEDEDGYTSLHLAGMHSGSEDIDVISKLLDKTTQIDQQNSNGDTPLHCAASHGNLSAAKMLVDRGSLWELPNNSGYTALHLAALNGNLEIVKYLMKCGASPKRIDKFNRTPRDCALSSGYTNIADLLQITD